MIENKQKRIYGYVRVSALEQLNGYSIDNQCLTLSRVADFRKLELDHIYKDEAKSAFKKNVKREEFDDLMDEVKNGNVIVLIIWKLDRLMRDHIKNEKMFKLFQRHKVTVISCTEGELSFDTADSRKNVRQKGVENQYESERTSERVLAALQTAAELGNYPKSRVPLGFKRIHKEYPAAPLIPDEIKSPQIVELFELVKSTKWGISKLLQHLNSIEFMNRHWSESYLYYILSDKIYIGTYHNKRYKSTQIIPNHTPALVPIDLFNEVQDIIHSRNYENKYKYTLKKYVVCNCCGNRLASVSAHNGHTKATYLYYFCKHCRKRVNQVKITLLVYPLFDDHMLQTHKTEVIDKAYDRIKRLHIVIKNLDSNFVNGILDEAYYQKEKKELLVSLHEETVKIEEYKKMNKLSWNMMTYSSQRAWLKSNINKIVYDFENENCIIDFVKEKN